MSHIARRCALAAAGVSLGSASPAASITSIASRVTAYGGIRLQPTSRGITSGTCSASNVGSHMSDNDPASLAHHKEKSLKGESPTFIPKTEGWHETLASVSEAVVKAERYVDSDTTSVPEKLELLQRQTVELVQQLHGESEAPKRPEQDVSGSPAHRANLEHTRKPLGTDPR